MNANAIVVEDDPNTSAGLAQALSKLGYSVSQACSLAQARQQFIDKAPDVVLLDLTLPDGNGLDLLKLRDMSDATRFVVITGDKSQESAVRSLRANVHDFVLKPVSLKSLRSAIKPAHGSAAVLPLHGRLRHPNTDAGKQRSAPSRGSGQSRWQADKKVGSVSLAAREHLLSIGASRVWKKLKADILAAAATSANVWLTGEPGTDRLAVAQAVYRYSWKRECLAYFDCSNNSVISERVAGHSDISEYLAHSAASPADLLVETWVFDNISSLPASVQRQLQGLLGRQSTVATPVAFGPQCITIVRNNDDSIATDLKYSLAQYEMMVPSVRERREDLGSLCAAILDRLNKIHNQRKTLSDCALKDIQAYDWPGNYRQLSNLVTQAFLSGGQSIEIAGFIPASEKAKQQQKAIESFVGTTFWEVERLLLFSTLKHFDGDKKRTAEALGVSLKTLYNRLNAYS
jgi:DNA-binding NtrC family response regulator